MKILIYCGYQNGKWESLDPRTSSLGGSEKCTLELFHRLKNYGHEVMLVGQGFKQYHDDCREYSYFRQDYTTSHWDVIIGVNYANLLIQVEQAQLTYDKMVLWLHNEEPFFWHRGIHMPELEKIYYDDRIDKVIGVSQVAVDRLVEAHPSVAHKFDYIPNGIDYGSTATVGEKKKNSFIYSSCPSRGLSQVLDLWPHIVAKLPDAELHICYPSYAEGSFGAIEQQLNEVQGMVGIDSIQVHGSMPQDQLYQLMASTEYWLYPTDYFETFCITALEMMAHRVKIISCAAGNVESLLYPSPTSKPNGTLVEYSEHSDELRDNFMAALDFVLANPAEIDLRMTRAQRYANALDWPNVVADWNEFVSQITGTEKGGWDPIEPNFYYPVAAPIEDTAPIEVPVPVEVQTPVNDKGEIPVDVVYVMGLDRTADWDDISARIDSMNLPEGVKFHKLPATDGRTLTHDSIRASNFTLYPWKMDPSETDNSWWLRDMTMGEIGCAISHAAIWQHAWENDYQRILILEEDFIIKDGYADFNWNNLPSNWQMFFLGRNAFGGPDIQSINEDVCVPFWSYNAHAYMLNRDAIETLHNSRFWDHLMPVDEYLGAFWLNNLPRNDISQVVKDKLVTYAIPQHIPDIIGQTSVTGLNSTTEGVGHDKKYPELYSFWTDRDAWVSRFISPGVASKEWDLLVDEPIAGVLEMPLFTEEFCEMIREEAEHAEAWTTDRHEFYPTTDMLLQAIDMHDIYMEVLREYVMPMAQETWQLFGEGWLDLRTENFLARYLPTAQGHLSLHHDYSDITALVNLSKPGIEFQGGGTYFERAKALSQGKQGYVTVHPGRITHRHGARPITSGSRYILVSFMSNGSIR